MEEQDEKSLEPSPKAHLISLMQAGHPWQTANGLFRSWTSVAGRRWHIVPRRRCARDKFARLLRACTCYLRPCSSLFFITSEPLAYPALSWSDWSLAHVGFTRLHR